ncbi:hypothetical protein ACFP2T_16715 [Plantactinospora solaniradicis]|uniref:Uncharacterized protein n=1 Tax=Plantactinospora solaniradicis TaxID=1723736 RepID=A0ABW1KA41_9ACTN
MENYSIRLTFLMPILILGTVLGSIMLAAAIHPGEDFQGAGFGVLAGVCLAAVGWLLHYGVGWLLNSRSTPQGREWHNRYVIGGLPAQYGGIVYVVIGWTVIAWNVGSASSPWLGWPMFLLLPIGAVLVAVLRDRRSHLAKQRAEQG